MTTTPPIESRSTRTNIDVSGIKNEIKKFSQIETKRLVYEVNEGRKNWTVLFHLTHEKHSYGKLRDLINTRIEFYKRNIETFEVWNPKIQANNKDRLIERQNLLMKLQRVLEENFEGWNELFDMARFNSTNYLLKSVITSLKWNFQLDEYQFEFIVELLKNGPMKLKTTYTQHDYSVVLPPNKSDQDKLKKIEEDYFKRLNN
ncbi:MAG TPA: hypothetical protein VLE96_02635 [Chlamydiales bacterium]|nr:hypothetical protein [Chlamydiales bacterium]